MKEYEERMAVVKELIDKGKNRVPSLITKSWIACKELN